MCGATSLRRAGEVAGFSFLECRRCLFVFTPQVTEPEQERFCREGQRSVERGAPAGGWPHGQLDFLRPAFERLPQVGQQTMLDFGAGQSHAPDQLRAAGHRVIAVDVEPPHRPHPDRLTGSLDELGLPPNTFDLAYSFQVFEHLPEPRPILELLLRLLRPGGLLLIHTDMETPERSDRLDAWWYVTPPDHCAFFRHRTFEHFLEGSPHRLAFTDPKSVIIAKASR